MGFNEDTIEKDVDLSTDRDVSRGVERTSLSGSDSKVFSTDNKVDVGEAEAVASVLAATASAYMGQMVEEKQRSMDRESDMHALKVQMMQNAISESNARANQSIRHTDLAVDRQWNVDEAGYQAAEMQKNMTEDDIRAIILAILAELKIGPTA